MLLNKRKRTDEIHETIGLNHEEFVNDAEMLTQKLVSDIFWKRW